MEKRYELYDQNGNLIESRVEVLTGEELKAAIRREIARLEAEITDRRRDEAILGIDGGWFVNKRAEIAAERAKL